MSETVWIGDRHEIYLAEREQLPASRAFVGRKQELRMCRAAWRVLPINGPKEEELHEPQFRLEEDDTHRLHFRLQGRPGVGKNEIVYQITRELNLPLFMIQGHEELTPEDMALMLVPDPEQSGRKTLSPNRRF